MQNIKIVTVIGARPQFVKAAVVSRALSKEKVKEYIIHTGQHYDKNLSEVFFEELEIPKPDYNLGVGSGTHAYQTAQMLLKIEELLLEIEPDWLLVYGDTNSTLAGALAASKLNIPVAHVEAGLRSYNRSMPEEINRILTDHVSDLLFVPTKRAYDNLKIEGIPDSKIHLTGDVMFDAALYYADKAEVASSILGKNNLAMKQYVLTTVHRAENTDNEKRLGSIIEGLSEVAVKIPVIFPLHPRAKEKIIQYDLLNKASDNLILIEPVGYLDMVMLEKNAALIATDSGGVQKEAFFYKVPCVTLREETEWVELLDSKWNTLCPPYNGNEISSAILKNMATAGYDVQPYGNGSSAREIVSVLVNIT